jgi:signal transduction histidine kinase/CheY-like chemotaxis protein
MFLKLRNFSRRLGVLDYVGVLLSSLALLLILYYGFLSQKALASAPFTVSRITWEIENVTENCRKAPDCPKFGDQILRIGELTRSEGLRNRRFPVYAPFEGEAPVLVELERNGQRHTLAVSVRGGPQAMVSFAVFCFPLIFWGTGTICLIFLRPRGERWLALVLFQFDTALWLAAGFLTWTGLAYSAVVYRMFIWPFLPLSVHLHLVLPDAPFKRYHGWILFPLYSVATLGLIADLLGLLRGPVSTLSTLVGILLSLGLLILRNFVQREPGSRVANRLMLYGVGMGLLPIFLLIFIDLLRLSPTMETFHFDLFSGVFLVMAPLWPLTYLYVIYRHHEGSFEFRANRWLGAYGFISLFMMGFPLIYTMVAHWWESRGLAAPVLGLLFSLVSVFVAPLLYSSFQRFIDRRIFHIKYRPNEVISVFAERIPNAFELKALEDVIVDEILPALLIRQSALYEIQGEFLETIYEQQVGAEKRPNDAAELKQLAIEAGGYISHSRRWRGKYSWVRLVIELSIRGEPFGMWLFGRRDPDDYFSRSDVRLLRNLANQIAPVVANLRLVEQAREEVAENRRLQQQLVHSQKMEAIGRLSAGVAHDFNNILSVIIGYSNLVMAQFGENESLKKAVGSIKDAGERAASLTKQLLAFSRKQVTEARIVNLGEVVGDVERMLRRLAGEDIDLRTEITRNLPNVKVDPGQMGQAIINLAVNARDAMPEGGKLRIKTREIVCSADGDSCPCHEGVPPGNYVLLEVCDNGTGIEPEVIASIFEPYFTTKEHGKGTGLGLSMVYGFINLSQGHIFVDSNLGQGTAFSIYLPAVPEEEVQEAQESRDTTKDHGGSETILLVEDEQSVRAVAYEILRSSGYEVIQARDGVEALEDFTRGGRKIDLLLTDVVMPHMKGTVLARRLLEIDPRLRVVYMSGYNEESILGRRIGEGGSILIQKPFSPQELTRKIRLVLDEPKILPGEGSTEGRTGRQTRS